MGCVSCTGRPIAPNDQLAEPRFQHDGRSQLHMKIFAFEVRDKCEPLWWNFVESTIFNIFPGPIGCPVFCGRIPPQSEAPDRNLNECQIGNRISNPTYTGTRVTINLAILQTGTSPLNIRNCAIAGQSLAAVTHLGALCRPRATLTRGM